MISDDERREVARRLRDKKAECEERGYPWMCDDLILALGYDHDYEAGDEIFDRLADLIDPGDNRNVLLDSPRRTCKDCRFWQKDPTARALGVCWRNYAERDCKDSYEARVEDAPACEYFSER